MASLLYGAGLRLRECLRLRVKDIDFGYKQVVVRDAKGQKDRVTMLPVALAEQLKMHLSHVACSAPIPVDARTSSSSYFAAAAGSRPSKVPRMAPTNPSGMLRIPGFSSGKIGGD